MQRFLTIIYVLISFSLTSCFDTIKHSQIVGPYYLLALDVPENLCVIYDENNGYGGGATIVEATVSGIEFNSEFILVKQHPLDDVVDIILRNYRKTLYDEMKDHKIKQGLNIDSLARLQFIKNKKTGQFDHLFGNREDSITLYYLIDIRNKSHRAKLYLNKQSLDSAMIKLNVGKLQRMEI